MSGCKTLNTWKEAIPYDLGQSLVSFFFDLRDLFLGPRKLWDIVETIVGPPSILPDVYQQSREFSTR